LAISKRSETGDIKKAMRKYRERESAEKNGQIRERERGIMIKMGRGEEGDKDGKRRRG